AKHPQSMAPALESWTADLPPRRSVNSARALLLRYPPGDGVVSLIPMHLATAGAPTIETQGDPQMVFETLKVSQEGAVLFVEIAAPPMNLLGPELVRDLVSLIQRAEADEG